MIVTSLITSQTTLYSCTFDSHTYVVTVFTPPGRVGRRVATGVYLATLATGVRSVAAAVFAVYSLLMTVHTVDGMVDG